MNFQLKFKSQSSKTNAISLSNYLKSFRKIFIKKTITTITFYHVNFLTLGNYMLDTMMTNTWGK